MLKDREIVEKISAAETRQSDKEIAYSRAVDHHQKYNTLKAMRNDIRVIKQELELLYKMRDLKM